MAAALPVIELFTAVAGTSYSVGQASSQAQAAKELQDKQTKSELDLENQQIDEMKKQTASQQGSELSNVAQRKAAALAAMGKANSTILTGPGSQQQNKTSAPKTLLGA